MGFVNRNVENTNRKVLKVLETSKQNNEITELVVEEYRYEGEVYSEGTPLEANSFKTIVQEVIDNDLKERVSNDCANLNISSIITNVISLPSRGINRSYINWSVLSGSGITITNNQMSVNRDLKDPYEVEHITPDHFEWYKDNQDKVSKRPYFAYIDEHLV